MNPTYTLAKITLVKIGSLLMPLAKIALPICVYKGLFEQFLGRLLMKNKRLRLI